MTNAVYPEKLGVRNSSGYFQGLCCVLDAASSWIATFGLIDPWVAIRLEH
jgi:hypothetical protein